MAFVPDAPTRFVPDVPTKFVPDAPASTAEPAVTQRPMAEGLADAALSGASRVAASTVGAPVALINRVIAAISGGDPNEAAAAAHDYVNSKFIHNAQTPLGKQIGQVATKVLAPVGESANYYKGLITSGLQKVGVSPGTTEGLLGETGDLAGTAGLVAPAVAGARASTEAAELAAQNAPAAVTRYGMQTGQGKDVAKNIAGASARPTVTAHNQSIADPVLGAQAGVPTGQRITPASLEAGRAAPNSVYQRAEQHIPTGPLSPNAAATIQGVGSDDMIVHSPDTQATIDAQKARLLSGPLTGSEVVNGQRALRFNGFRNVASEDPEASALGRAQLKMADALHQHMVDTLPENAPVTSDQLAAARVALAQNHTVESVLGPNGNVNLTKLAKVHNDNPGMLSGPMADIAQFASDHPEVTRLPSDAERFNPSGVLHDVASIDLKKPLSYVQPFLGTVARRALTGPKPSVSPSVTGLGGEFGPVAPRQPAPLSLSPAPGTAFEPHQPQVATGAPTQRDFFGTGTAGMTASPPAGGAPPAAGPPGQIPLADLLSHGVEQPPSAGLSLAPTPAAPTGVPFVRNAAHEAGGLEVAPEDAWFKGGAPDLRDLGHVMSQGVPDDIVARAPQAGPRPKVAHSPAFIPENNAAGGKTTREAVNRTAQDIASGVKPISFGADDQAHPLSVHDIQRADLNPAPDSIFIDASVPGGKIINSGNMAPRAAQALLARWKALHGNRDLGHSFQ